MQTSETIEAAQVQLAEMEPGATIRKLRERVTALQEQTQDVPKVLLRALEKDPAERKVLEVLIDKKWEASLNQHAINSWGYFGPKDGKKRYVAPILNSEEELEDMAQGVIAEVAEEWHSDNQGRIESLIDDAGLLNTMVGEFIISVHAFYANPEVTVESVFWDCVEIPEVRHHAEPPDRKEDE